MAVERMYMPRWNAHCSYFVLASVESTLVAAVSAADTDMKTHSAARFGQTTEAMTVEAEYDFPSRARTCWVTAGPSSVDGASFAGSIESDIGIDTAADIAVGIADCSPSTGEHPEIDRSSLIQAPRCSAVPCGMRARYT